MNIVSVGEVVKISKGKKVDSSSSVQTPNNSRYIQIDDLRNDKNLKFTTDKGVQVTEDDVIIAWDGANAGTIGYGLKGVIGSTLAKLEITDKTIMPEYLGRFLQTKSAYLRQYSTGATIPHISRDVLAAIKIPVPSIDEQKVILDKLEQADSLRQNRKQAIDLLDEYLKSVFLEMFGDPVINPKRLNTLTLGELAKKVTDGTHKTPKYTTVGVKFISAKNIKQESIDWSDVKYISEEEHKAIYKRCNPEKEDILLTKSGSLGMAAIVDVDFEFSLFESLALLKINKELVDPIYLREYLNLEQIKSLYTRITKGVGVKHLHLIDIKSLPVILPKIDEQKKFVNIVGKTEDIKKKMIKQSEELDMLFQSLLQKSFSSN